MATPLKVTFRAGETGSWCIDRVAPVVGESLPPAACLEILEGGSPSDLSLGSWTLVGFTSNERYVERAERSALAASPAPLGRPGSTRAALIPIRKSEAWWDLTQDERREVFEAQSHHIAVGLEYLPGVARRLHHCRDLGEEFDFLTWFEYHPDDARQFERLVDRLRGSPEWDYVEREVDIRLTALAQ